MHSSWKGRRLGIALALLAVLLADGIARAEGNAAPDSAVRALQTGSIGPDKLQHASLSLTLGLGFGLATRKPAVALAAPLALGLAKEMRDRRHTRFDPADLVADIVGVTLAALLVREVER